MRIWEQKSNAPGLTTTRSFGDTIAHSIGATHKPEIIEYTLDMKIKRDTFLILASDGVWQYMTNNEVAKIVFDSY